MTTLVPLLTINDLCEHFRMGRTAGTRRILHWIETGAIVPIDLNPEGTRRKYRFRPSDVNTLETRLAQRCTPPAARPGRVSGVETAESGSTLRLSDFLPRAG